MGCQHPGRSAPAPSFLTPRWQSARCRGVNLAPQAGGLRRTAGLRARLSPRFVGRAYRRIKKPLGRGSFKFSPTSVKLVPQFPRCTTGIHSPRYLHGKCSVWRRVRGFRSCSDQMRARPPGGEWVLSSRCSSELGSLSFSHWCRGRQFSNRFTIHPTQ